MDEAFFQVTKGSLLQIETSKVLATHPVGEVKESLASGGLRKLYLRNLYFYSPIIRR